MRRSLQIALASLFMASCASMQTPRINPGVRIEVLTPMDRVPVTRPDAFPPGAGANDLTARRTAAMRALRGNLADTLATRGAEVCEGDLGVLTGAQPTPAALAAIGRTDQADVVISTEFIAYGAVRHSWLWLLAGQGLAAGIGHGIVVAKATGSVRSGWVLGTGEFLLEVATWVGGTVLAARVIDPVIVRVSAIRTSDGAVLGRWTREGTSPVHEWMRRGREPQAERLRKLTEKLFKAVAPKILRKIAADR